MTHHEALVEAVAKAIHENRWVIPWQEAPDNVTDAARRNARAAIPVVLEVLKPDLIYLAKLVDWAAGEGFHRIEGLEDPEEWVFRRWSALGPANGDGYSAEALGKALALEGEHP